jgi:hypothetical protein
MRYSPDAHMDANMMTDLPIDGVTVVPKSNRRCPKVSFQIYFTLSAVLQAPYFRFAGDNCPNARNRRSPYIEKEPRDCSSAG